LENGDVDKNEAALVAFRKMATNAIPAPLKWFKSGGPPLQKMISKLNRQQSVVDLPFGTPWHQTMAASWALYAMGTNAKPALPVLTNLLFHSNALITSTVVMAGIGSEAIPILLSALTNQNYRIRHSAASGLGWAHSDLDVVVPALIAMLQDSERIVRYTAASSLGEVHARPEIAVPALMNALSSDDPLLRSTALISLGGFEGKANEAVPAVVAALKDKDETVRKTAASVLKQIDPESAAKEGVR